MMEIMPFFTVDDVQALTEVANLKYDSNNPEHVKLKNNLINGVWEKTKFWHNSVLESFKKYDYVGAIKKRWDNHGQSFKHYTWTQIYKDGDVDKGIYFTVGVDGDKDTSALIYKLDYDYTSGRLTSEQKELVKKLIQESDAGWLTIESDKLVNYSWEKLIKETVYFIVKYTFLYDECIERVWNINPQRVARIVYNTKGWEKPSGVEGKSPNGLYETDNGYGHEEWLFDFNKLYNGYHYAFLEPIRRQYQAYVNHKFDIYLYTVNSQTKKRYFVGKINDAEVVSSDTAEKVWNYYKERNWVKEMAQQVADVSATIQDFRANRDDGLFLFNIRFLPYNVRFNPNPDISIPENNPINKSSRYSFMHYKPDFNFDTGILNGENDEIDNVTDKYNFRATYDSSQDDENQLIVNKYNRSPKSVEISYFHKEISNMLLRKLQEKFGKDKVGRELGAGYGENKIDMAVHELDGDVFYEIKTYSSLRVSIREAFGQIMEYAHWINNKRAKEMIIVTQNTGEINEAKKYLSNIRNLYHIPIYYQYMDVKNNFLSEKV